MTQVCLDASTIVPMLVREGSSDAVDQLIERLESPPVVSTFAVGEAGSALARLYRMDMLTAPDVRERLASLDRWLTLDADLVELEASDVRLAGLFVRKVELGLRMPDAIHVAVSQRLGATLATLDVRLAGAAAALDVKVLIPGS
ncbi:MAG: type II toxin-antitoxin system VapC family toxin [Sphingopyxis sp.]|uniref:type II toxin-antitoxin system VapC family toxin n=1 Tax=Sphingopyxis sp. TaxID=1908224 RepID=UPI001A2B2D3E|nr:type II toxin-antitoxin system VapC family toxin [Sphingopyxis sp.]MBJ7499662.1 type II toxin-antitoxin system VapC family toxin [Sphingopyxis sp.]